MFYYNYKDFFCEVTELDKIIGKMLKFLVHLLQVYFLELKKEAPVR